MPASRYKIWAWGGPVGKGGMGSFHVGIAGVAKAAKEKHPSVVSNELLCGELGRAVRLPVPPGFLIERDQTPYHVSLNFNLAGEDLPPADVAALVNDQPDLACGILLFDIWIVNTDRHKGNLAYDKTTGKVQLFDHSHAFMPGESGREHLEKNENALGIQNHCLPPVLPSVAGMREWYDRINAIPEFWIREFIEAATTVGLPMDSADYCSEFLLSRREKLLDLLSNHKESLPKVEPELWDAV